MALWDPSAKAWATTTNNEQLMEELMKLTREVVTEKKKADSVDKGCPMKDY